MVGFAMAFLIVIGVGIYAGRYVHPVIALGVVLALVSALASIKESVRTYTKFLSLLLEPSLESIALWWFSILIVGTTTNILARR